jgi:CarboxypepD_reg-like domain/TonB-dependent Receptor Plug Domain
MLRNLIFILTFLMAQAAVAQKFTLKGYIKDAKNGEDLIGVAVAVPALSTGATTNEYGFFSLTLPTGTYEIEIAYLGYKTARQTLVLTKDITQNFEIKEDVIGLQEVEVVADALPEENVKNVEMSVNKVSIAEIKRIPPLMGEVDVVRSLTLLPGVTTVGEGATGINVRGGGIDQNLILLDEAPVYNSSHLLGLFSAFNPDVVKDVKLYKGGIPAQYGGRASAVLDIRMKEGNKKHFEMTGGVGLIFSRLSLEAPIKKDKGSFIVAARRSYIDYLAKPFFGKRPTNSCLFLRHHRQGQLYFGFKR